MRRRPRSKNQRKSMFFAACFAPLRSPFILSAFIRVHLRFQSNGGRERFDRYRIVALALLFQ